MNRLMKMCTTLLLAMGLAMPLWAQDVAETDDLNPAVDTSEEMPAVNTSDTDDIEPAATPQDLSPRDGTRTLEDGRESRTVVTTSEVLTPARNSASSESGTLTTTTITGNAELPRVLYIVPWQKADPGDLMGKPVNSLLDELLQPIDRDEFRRQLRYYDDLHVSEAGGDPQ